MGKTYSEEDCNEGKIERIIDRQSRFGINNTQNSTIWVSPLRMMLGPRTEAGNQYQRIIIIT